LDVAWHVAGVNVFASPLHDAGPLTVKPKLHVGAQVLPAANILEQSPFAPLAGAPEASQVFAWQPPKLKVPPALAHVRVAAPL
jgi:hypothetical protein